MLPSILRCVIFGLWLIQSSWSVFFSRYEYRFYMYITHYIASAHNFFSISLVLIIDIIMSRMVWFFSFYDSILMWCVRCCEVHADLLVVAIWFKLVGHVFSISVWSQRLNILHVAFLIMTLNFLKVINASEFSLGSTPNIFSKIINQGDEVFFLAEWVWSDWSTNVDIDQLKRSLCWIFWFPYHTPFTEFILELEIQQSFHWLFLNKIFETNVPHIFKPCHNQASSYLLT
jgi:hypothetical protein